MPNSFCDRCDWINPKRAFLVCAVFVLLILSLSSTKVRAHDGEDHSQDKTATVTTDKGTATVTHTAKVGKLEVLLKHTRFEPDAASTARLFVTDFATNEPLVNASPNLQLVAENGGTYPVETSQTGAPGSFSAQLPPLPAGSYTILARLTFNGETDTATFANVNVAPQNAAENAGASISSASWATSILLLIAGVVILSAIGAFGYFAARYAGREQQRQQSVAPKDVVSA